jgi:hypothetical protein
MSAFVGGIVLLISSFAFGSGFDLPIPGNPPSLILDPSSTADGKAVVTYIIDVPAPVKGFHGLLGMKRDDWRQKPEAAIQRVRNALEKVQALPNECDGKAVAIAFLQNLETILSNPVLHQLEDSVYRKLKKDRVVFQGRVPSKIAASLVHLFHSLSDDEKRFANVEMLRKRWQLLVHDMSNPWGGRFLDRVGPYDPTQSEEDDEEEVESDSAAGNGEAEVAPAVELAFSGDTAPRNAIDRFLKSHRETRPTSRWKNCSSLLIFVAGVFSTAAIYQYGDRLYWGAGGGDPTPKVEKALEDAKKNAPKIAEPTHPVKADPTKNPSVQKYLDPDD